MLERSARAPHVSKKGESLEALPRSDASAAPHVPHRGTGATPPSSSNHWLPPRSVWHRIQDPIAHVLITLVSAGAIIAVFLIFLFVGKEGAPIVYDEAVREDVRIEHLFLPQPPKEGRPPVYRWRPVSKRPRYNLVPLIVGTLKITLVAIVAAFPPAILAALFSVEFAPRGVREVLKPIVELLAGIPSVVLGFFALMIMAPRLKAWLGLDYQLNALVAGLAVGIAVLPIFFTVSEDAFNAVPRSYREASYALGADHFTTAWRIVLPSALPGVFAALVLGMGRAIGETMIVLMASGNAPLLSWSVTDSVRTLSATIAAEMLEVVQGDVHYRVLFFMGTLLFTLTFLINFLGDLAVARLERRFGGD